MKLSFRRESAPETPESQPVPVVVAEPEDEPTALRRELEEAAANGCAADETKADASQKLQEARERRARLEAERLGAMRRGDGEARTQLSKDALQALADEQDRDQLLQEANRMAEGVWKKHGEIAERISALELKLAKSAVFERAKALVAAYVAARKAANDSTQEFLKTMELLRALGADAEISHLAGLREETRRAFNLSGVSGDLFQ